jgi:peptidyl-dipeptidase A
MSQALLEVLDAHDRKVEPLYRDYTLRFWAMSTQGTRAAVDALVAAKERYLAVFSDPETFGKLKTFRDEPSAGRDPLLARRLERLFQAFVPYQMDPDALAAMVRSETDLENDFNNYRASFLGRRVSDNQLRDALRTETDPDRRRMAWEASKQVGSEVADGLLALVASRNREARRLGYRDYYQLMLATAELSEEWLFALLDELERSSEAAFVAVKTELDEALRERYGVRGTEAWPWLYSDPFFQELPSAGITESLDEIFGSQDLAALTRDHFQALGLEIGDLLERADLYEREGKSQHAFCLDVDRQGDVRVLCNLKADERWMSTLLHEFGHAVYDKYSDPALPFTLREPAHVFTTEAVAMLNGRMNRTPVWLERFARVPETMASGLAGEMFRAMRTSMLIFLRWGLTLVRFERELYRDPGQDLDTLWWDLVERIQKVTRPVGRAAPDWASKIHLAVSPVYYQNYILGELMASQLFEHISSSVASGGDFLTPQVGDYLVGEIFRPGARWHWNELLHRATGAELTPEPFLSEFRIEAESPSRS